MSEPLLNGLSNKKSYQVTKDELSTAELCRDYLIHCEEYFRKPNGRYTSSLGIIKEAYKPRKKLYCRTLAKDFGPVGVHAIQQGWIEQDLTRKTINEYTSSLKRLFKWGASHEKIDIMRT